MFVMWSIARDLLTMMVSDDICKKDRLRWELRHSFKDGMRKGAGIATHGWRRGLLAARAEVPNGANVLPSSCLTRAEGLAPRPAPELVTVDGGSGNCEPTRPPILRQIHAVLLVLTLASIGQWTFAASVQGEDRT